MKTSLNDRLTQWLGALNAGSIALGARNVELRLPPGWPEKDPSVHWWNRAEGTTGHAESLAQLPAAARAAPVPVWTPPAETLLTRTTLPTRSRARILQALPFALEDQLLDDPQALHFAYVREPDGSLAVAVTQRARLNLWLDILKGAGIRPASLCPAMLALPRYPDSWSIAFVDNELWVRSGERAGFVTFATNDPSPLLATALKEAAPQGGAPKQIVALLPPHTVDVAAWSETLGLPVVAEPTDFRQVAPAPPLNLLQADFGPAAHAQALLRPLRPAAIMLALWLVATLALDVTEWLRLRHAHNTYLAEMHEIYKQAFGSPAQYPYDQMRKGVEALQSRGGGPADLLPLLTRVAPTLQAQAARVKLRTVKYTERSLTLDLTLPDSQTLDAVKNALQAANLDVEVIAANGRGNEVDGRLRVQPGGTRARSSQRS